MVKLTNDLRWIGFHREKTFGVMCSGTTSSADVTSGSSRVVVYDPSGLDVGDVISLGRTDDGGWNRVITAIAGSNVDVYPSFGTAIPAGSAVVLHYKLVKGHVTAVEWTTDIKSEGIRKLETKRILPSFALRKVSETSLKVEYILAGDIEKNIDGAYSQYSSLIGSFIGVQDAITKNKVNKRTKYDPVQTWTFYVRSMSNGDWSGETVLRGCVPKSARIDVKEDSIKVSLEFAVQREDEVETLGPELNIFGSSKITTGKGRTDIPESWKGAYFLAHGHTTTYTKLCSRLTQDANSGQPNVAVDFAKYFGVGEDCRIYDDVNEETVSISSVTGTIITLTSNLAYSYNMDRSFIVSGNRHDLKGVEITIENDTEYLPVIGTTQYPKFIATKSQTQRAMFTLYRENRMYMRYSQRDPYYNMLELEIVFARGSESVKIILKECINKTVSKEARKTEMEIETNDIEVEPCDIEYSLTA